MLTAALLGLVMVTQVEGQRCGTVIAAAIPDQGDSLTVLMETSEGEFATLSLESSAFAVYSSFVGLLKGSMVCAFEPEDTVTLSLNRKLPVDDPLHFRIVALADTSLASQVPYDVIPICVSHDSEDTVGIALAFEVREGIRRSAGYRLVECESAFAEISLATLDPDKSNNLRGTTTAASMAISAGTTASLLAHVVLTSGSNRVQSTGRNIVAALDDAMQRLRREKRP